MATEALMRSVGLAGGQTAVIMTSIMHASGLICLLPTLMQGSVLAMLPAFDPAGVVDTIERHRCTLVVGLPAMIQFVVEEQARQPRDVSSTRLAFAGGDTVSLQLQERFEKLFGVPLFEIYGMTEGVPVTCNLPGATRVGSIGRALPGVNVRLLDLLGRDVSEGEIGEIAFQCPTAFSGYWNDERSTAAALVDGWVLSGDLGWRDADGYYWFCGRKKEIIVRGGSNIAPQEVEEALYHHPAVLEVGVVGVPDPVYGERVAACVALRDGRMAGEEELLSFARARLADYKVPERIIFLNELPKGITGKIHRRTLKELAGAQVKAQSV